MREWNATEAKQHFGELLNASDAEPQMITVRGAPRAVLVEAQQFSRVARFGVQATVSEWLERLRRLEDDAMDLDLPEREDRADGFGPDWV